LLRADAEQIKRVLDAQSEVGRGATFTFTLPALEAAVEGGAGEQDAPSKAKRPSG
jgi:hypothetical protein